MQALCRQLICIHILVFSACSRSPLPWFAPQSSLPSAYHMVQTISCRLILSWLASEFSALPTLQVCIQSWTVVLRKPSTRTQMCRSTRCVASGVVRPPFLIFYLGRRQGACANERHPTRDRRSAMMDDSTLS